MNKKQPTLIFCVLMDIIGYVSYALPLLGEFTDMVWAPISGFIFYKAFGGWKGAMGGVLNFVEEILPGIDFIPSFTITWLWKYFSNKQVSTALKNYKLVK